MERRWRAGIGLKRVLVAGSGDLGRLVVDRILEHRELGLKVVGFVDDQAEGGAHLGYRGLPLLGTLDETPEILQREKIDHLYVALPLDEHVKMLGLVENANREIVDIRVVPDLLQIISLRARLEDLDGLPIINIHDVPLRGLNAVLKRTMDFVLAALSLLVLAIPMIILTLLIRITSPGPALFRQERMGLDGKAFYVWKFRSMADGAERNSGPVWAVEDDPRCTPVGQFLRRSNLDELPQLWNVLRGDMSLVGPRPERPFFVDQFKQRIPQYMLRHKVTRRPHRVGAGQRLARQHLHREAHRVRPVLHRELVAHAGPQDHVADRGQGVLPQARVLRPARHATHCHHRSRRLHRLPPR